MVGRANGVAWGLAAILAMVLVGAVGLGVVVGIPVYLGHPGGPYAVGLQVAGRWQIGSAPVYMSTGRAIKLGCLEFYLGTPLTK